MRIIKRLDLPTLRKFAIKYQPLGLWENIAFHRRLKAVLKEASSGKASTKKIAAFQKRYEPITRQGHKYWEFMHMLDDAVAEYCKKVKNDMP